MSVRIGNAVVGESIEIRKLFYDDSDGPFNPVSFTNVVIIDVATGTTLETISSANINQVTDEEPVGEFRIFTSAGWNTAARTIRHIWTFKRISGGADKFAYGSLFIPESTAPSSPDVPTATECREHLEGYGITTSILSDAWIEDERDNTMLPFVEKFTGDLSAAETITDYISGNGTDVLMLRHRNVNSLTSIEIVGATDIIGSISLNSVILISGQGIIKAESRISEGLTFPLFPRGNKNIKVVYTIGGTVTNKLKQAMKKLTCLLMLDNIEGRTGGGALTVQNFSRQYGDHGKYTNIRKRLYRAAKVTLNSYKTGVVSR